jgi:hypothetical protein
LHKLTFHRDEDNLEENERIKKELNPTKINEPKTPFHLSPMNTDDEFDQAMEVEQGAMMLSLEDNKDNNYSGIEAGAGPSSSTAPPPPPALGASQQQKHQYQKKTIAPNGWSDSDKSGGPSPRHTGGSSKHVSFTTSSSLDDDNDTYNDNHDHDHDQDQGSRGMTKPNNNIDNSGGNGLRGIRIGRQTSPATRSKQSAEYYGSSSGGGGGGRGGGSSSSSGNDSDSENDDEEGGGGADQRKREKRRKFAELRKKHYNMRSTLIQAKELMQADEEDNEEEESEGRKNGLHFGNGHLQRHEDSDD